MKKPTSYPAAPAAATAHAGAVIGDPATMLPATPQTAEQRFRHHAEQLAAAWQELVGTGHHIAAPFSRDDLARLGISAGARAHPMPDAVQPVPLSLAGEAAIQVDSDAPAAS